MELIIFKGKCFTSSLTTCDGWTYIVKNGKRLDFLCGSYYVIFWVLSLSVLFCFFFVVCFGVLLYFTLRTSLSPSRRNPVKRTFITGSKVRFIFLLDELPGPLVGFPSSFPLS